MKLYSFGDSHSIVFEKSTHTTQNFWLGGWTMHRFGRDFLNLTDIHCSPIEYRHYSIPNDGIILSSFGEIDVRNHIHHQVMLGRDIHEICNKLASDYILNLSINRERNGYSKIAVLAVNPCRRATPDIEMKGTDQQRKLYHDTLNFYLKSYCDAASIYFLDLNPYYTDSDGMLNDSLRDASVHVLFTQHVDDEIIKMFNYFS